MNDIYHVKTSPTNGNQNLLILGWHEAWRRNNGDILKANSQRKKIKFKGGFAPRIAGTKKVKSPAVPVVIDPATLLLKPKDGFKPHYVVEFDGGIGYSAPPYHLGVGYGSFQFGHHPVKRVDLGRDHRSDSAEVTTLGMALNHLADFVEKVGDKPSRLSVLVRGDSDAAMRWMMGLSKVRSRHTDKLLDGIVLAKSAAKRFKEVQCEWRSRKHSVLLFGH